MPNYARVLIKISGEALSGSQDIYDQEKLRFVAGEIVQLVRAGVQCGVVVGAGNIWRGRQKDSDMSATVADYMGMLATCINALALSEAIRLAGAQGKGSDARICASGTPSDASTGAAGIGQPFGTNANSSDADAGPVTCKVYSSVGVDGMMPAFCAASAIADLNRGRVVIVAGGTGSPYFSTDTAAVLRALELEADAVLMAKNVPGVFTADPKRDPAARMYRAISAQACIQNNLKAADLAAMALVMEHNLTLEVFELSPGLMLAAARGESTGTRVSNAVTEAILAY